MYGLTSFIIACGAMFAALIIAQTGVLDTIRFMLEGSP